VLCTAGITLRDGNLQIRAEGQQAAVAIFHYKLSRVPWHVGELPSELHTIGCVLGIKRVCIFDEEVGVQQFVVIFIWIGSGRVGAAEVNRMLVARDYGVGWRILPCPQTLEAEFVFVIGERAGNVGGEELGRDLTDHGSSVRRALSTVAGLRLST